MAKTFRKTRNKRGFAMRFFKDRYGSDCIIQKSSLATEHAIWIGAEDIGLQEFIPFRKPSAWQAVTVEDLKSRLGGESYIANNRMHLTQKDVKKLLPVLQKFVETGEI